ncbi:transglycosylase SLT domain-containing protein [Streptomyces sp. OK228]|uniref:transglycosylase SLT domain-containing protein n=1 Tax=Streptomyces sp. OK228 TaxID=1882786 RepID=UPI000BCFD390|nr:transglycosylase SLT domain-containing protein [Streptomyces sp. OK228]SOE25603.1 Transglycosylase SLT domain-containing protein [Streptomyces sp. OK228]
MATVTGLNFNINSRFSSTGIAEARAAMAAFDEEQRRQNRLRATTAAAQARLDQQEAAARLAAQRRELDTALRMREEAWRQELARRRAVLAAQLDAERQHMQQVQDDFKQGWTKVQSTVTGAMTSISNAVLGLGPAIVPIASAAAGVAGGLVASAAAAGAAAGIFGGALVGAMKSADSATKSAHSALKRQQDLLATLTPGTKKYADQLKKVQAAQTGLAQVISTLSPAQQKYANSVDTLSGAWGKFIQQTESSTLTPVAIVLDAIGRNLGKLVPVVKAVSPLVTGLARDFAKWLNGPGLDRFVKTIVKQGVPALHNFIEIGRSVVTVLGQGFRDFLPFGNKVVAKLAEGARKLADWAGGGGFQRFLDYVHGVAPQVGDFFRALVTALVNIGKAAANLSGTSFNVLTVLLQVLASLPPDLLANLVRAWLLWNAALVVYGIVGAIAATVTAALALAATGMGLIFLGMALTVGIVVLALAALAVGIYFLVQNWSTVSAFLVKIWDATWNWIKNTALTVWGFLSHGWGQFILLLLGPIGLLTLLYLHWRDIWGAIQVAAQAVWDALKTAWSASIGWLSGAWDTVLGGLLTAWNAFSSPFLTSWNTVWPQVQQAAANIWTALTIAWGVLWAGVTAVWNAFWGVFGGTFTTAWTGAGATTSAVWGFLTAAWQLVWTVIVSVYQVGWAILSGAWSVGWAFLTGAAQMAWAIFTGAWSVIWAVVTGIWNVFYATFGAIFAGAWSVIVAIATGIWNVVKAAWTALWAVVTAIFLTFTAIFTGNWGMAWNAIKDAAAAIWNLIKTAWQAFLNVVAAVFSAFVGVLSAAWHAFWTAIQAVASTAWSAFRGFFQAFLTAVQAVWNTAWAAVRMIFQTDINAVINVASAAWSTLRAAVGLFLTAVQAVWNTAWTAVRTLFQTAVNGVITAATVFWNAIRTAFSGGSTWLRNTFWNPVSNFFTKTIPGAFTTGADALGKAWGAIKKLVRDPIQAVVNVVYNGGIVKLWNAVAGVFGASKLSAFNLPQFAEGGPTGPGSAQGFPAVLHPNEHVWTSAEVDAAGGHKAVAAMRSMVLGGSGVRVMGQPGGAFDNGGGILGKIGGAIGSVAGDIGGAIGSVVGKLKNLVLGGVYKVISGPINTAVKAAQAAVRGVTADGSGIQKLGEAIPKKIGDTVLSWIKGKDVAQFTSSAVGSIPSGQHRAVIDAALKAAGVPPPGTLAQWETGLNTLITRESGWNPNAVNQTDINAKNGVPSQGLAQVIPPTFVSNHVAGTSNNILDPVANVAAAIRYITRGYGNITNVQQANAGLPPKGYVLGTPGANSGWATVGEQGPERIRFRGGERVDPLRDLIGNGGSGDVNVTVTIPISGNADHGVVDRLEQQTIPKLTMAIKQGVGKRR